MSRQSLLLSKESDLEQKSTGLVGIDLDTAPNSALQSGDEKHWYTIREMVAADKPFFFVPEDQVDNPSPLIHLPFHPILHLCLFVRLRCLALPYSLLLSPFPNLSSHLCMSQVPGVPKLVPETRDAFLELTLLGCRAMAPLGFMKLQNPYLIFSIGSGPQAETFETAPSNKPSGSDPNFLIRQIIPVKLPLNPLFTPRLALTGFDKRFGGLVNAVVGAASIDLSKKVFWSDEYEPPRIMGSVNFDDRGTVGIN